MPLFLTPARLVVRLVALLSITPLALAGQEDDGEARTLYWRDFAVQAHLDGDGRLHVRERQTMVFDGAWNGGERGFDLRLGQEIELHGISRIDPATGSAIRLTRGELDGVDEFGWVGGERVRWRSRLESDPPFREQDLTYELEYTLWPVLIPSDDVGYLLSHDFAFADRAGVIERFEVELTFDAAWLAPGGSTVREEAELLPPGRGYTIGRALRYVGAGEPAAVVAGPTAWGRLLSVGGALLIPLLVLLGLRRRTREIERIAPLTAPDAIDENWLRSHLFSYPAEVVGTAWDRSVGAAEVAALLARLVQEGKLTSRVEAIDGDAVLHLQRVAPLSDFPEHERKLLEGLFFDGTDRTDSRAIREHYAAKGFDPASLIREALTARLDSLPGKGRVRRPWLSGLGLVLIGMVLVVSFAPALEIGILILIAATIAGGMALASALLLARRVTHRTGPTIGLLVPLFLLSLMLALLGGGVFEGEGGFLFYRPGAALLLGNFAVLAGLGLMATALSRPTDTPERLVLRRRLVSARDFFERELARPDPRLQDAWFPYLLAFGLGPHIDQWFHEFGGTRSTTTGAAVLVATGGGRSGAGHSGGGGWSGGGPQFGGGSWGGGGTGGSWSVAAVGMAAGVTAPSSSGGGGGGGGSSSSGGGSGGGW